jgi:hypothetical protein
LDSTEPLNRLIRTVFTEGFVPVKQQAQKREHDYWQDVFGLFEVNFH